MSKLSLVNRDTERLLCVGNHQRFAAFDALLRGVVACKDILRRVQSDVTELN